MSDPLGEILQLTELDIAVAERVGPERDAYAASRRYSSRHSEAGKRMSSLDNHILGVKSELAVARVLRQPWRSHVGTIEGTDVGSDVEVRCRRLRDPSQAFDAPTIIGRGLLTLHPRDHEKTEKAFVLVHAYAGDPTDVLRAIGWRLGGEVMQDRYWQEDPDMACGVYRVPHDELRTMSELIELLDYRSEQRHDERLAAYLKR